MEHPEQPSGDVGNLSLQIRGAQKNIRLPRWLLTMCGEIAPQSSIFPWFENLTNFETLRPSSHLPLAAMMGKGGAGSYVCFPSDRICKQSVQRYQGDSERSAHETRSRRGAQGAPGIA